MEFVNGFLLSLSLILAIGAQNAFVFRTGLEGRHVFAVCLFCALSDALLILVGIAGVGSLLSATDGLTFWLYIIAAVWLIAYGALRLKDAFGGKSKLHIGNGKDKDGRKATPLTATLLAVAGLTWLNPHVYLDTVVLLGGISATLTAEARPVFGAGAISANFVFFFALGYGARIMGRRINNPDIWKWIDYGIAVVMFWLAGGLLIAALS